MQDWKFDRTIAANFITHARKHIPDYDLVIDKCLSYANYNLPTSANILDFGSATGYTLQQFHNKGFYNLYGIESSADMLEQCDRGIANYLQAESVPSNYNSFDLIMSNWTLHFIKHKHALLTQFYNSLKDKGTLIVSEKVTETPLALDMYHQWKLKQGVTEEEVYAKHESLRNVLHVQSNTWWLYTLKDVGFSNIQIINANWCFCTYLCIKE